MISMDLTYPNMRGGQQHGFDKPIGHVRGTVWNEKECAATCVERSSIWTTTPKKIQGGFVNQP